MSSTQDDLAARKRLLLARSTLHRLQIQHEARVLRHSLTSSRTALSIATSPPMRSLVFSVLLLAAGRGRAARLLRVAAGVLMIAKAAQAGYAWMQSRPQEGETPRH